MKTMSAALTAASTRPALRNAAWVTLFATLVAVGGHVRIPIPGNPVPLTLQVVFVLATGAFLAPAAAAASMVLFIVAGVAGAPVFAGNGAGMGYLLGPTGGYLAAFPIGAALCSMLLRGRRESFLRVAMAMGAALGTIHLLGMLRLALFLGGDFGAAFTLGVVPFITIDLVKLFTAAAMVTGAASLAPPAEGRGWN